MTSLLTHAELWLTHLARTTLHAGVLAMVVYALVLMLGRRLSAGVRYMLWGLVLLRLAMPVLPAVRWSPMLLLPQSAQGQAGAANVPPTSGDLKWEVHLGGMDLPRTSEPVAAGPVRPRVPRWPILLAGAWAGVAAGLMLAAIVSYRRLLRRLRRGQTPTDAAVLRLVVDCAREMRVRTPAIVESALVDGPALAGIIRPTIVMPLGLAGRLSPRQWRHVILHELAHLKRHDRWIDWGILALVCLHWFNPLAWLAAWRFRTEREVLRDAMVLNHGREQEREAYGRTLVDLIETLARPAARAGAVGMLAERSDLRRRLSMILSGNRRSLMRTMLGGVLVVGLTLAGFTRAEDAKPAPVTRPATLPGKAVVADNTNTRWVEDQLGGKRLQELRFDGIALEEVVDFLRDVSGANITVNWKAIEAAGIKKAAPVTVRLRDIKFGKALSEILANVSGGKVRLAYTFDDRALVISTVEDIAQNHRQTIVYDIRDLLVDLSVVATPAAGGAAVKEDAKTVKLDERMAKDISNLIKETVDRESWTDNGGKTGQLSFLNGQFVITQTRENQQEIAGLLDKLRESRSIQVSVEVRFIQIQRGQFAAIAKDAGIELDVADKVGPLADTKIPATRPGVFINDVKLKAVLAAVQAAKDATVLTSPRMTTFNGCAGTVTVGSERAYISGYREGRPGEEKWVPVTANVNDGINVEVQPTVSADRKFITVKLHPRVAEFRRMREEPWDQAPAGEKLMVQKPEMDVQEINSILSILDGQTLMMVLPKTAGKNAETGMVTLFTARPTIIIQEEAEQAPAVKP
ncbi:MAG: M56 family metallopeptidase [Tepidisphaeraceae bacterium]